jgi:hypothetical protein
VSGYSHALYPSCRRLGGSLRCEIPHLHCKYHNSSTVIPIFVTASLGVPGSRPVRRPVVAHRGLQLSEELTAHSS